MADFNLFLPLTKVKANDDGTCTVSGYASTPTLDLDNEIVSLDAVKAALPGYMQWRNVREMHSPRAVGTAKEANVDSKGLFLTSRIVDKDAVQKCLEGVYKGYSIGGRKLAKSGNTITEIELIEVSIVDRPANPDCRIEVAKSAKAGTGAYMVPAKPKRDLLAKTLRSIAKVSEHLNPPAAHDGLSLPAHVTKDAIGCKAHGVAGCDECKCALHKVIDCEKCMGKRDFSTQQRREAADSGAALPDGSFPIKNQEDLTNAVRLWGHAKDKNKARKHIISRVKTLGLSLPDSFSTKLAKFVEKRKAKKLAKRTRAAYVSPHLDLAKAAEPSFLTLSADLGGDADAAQGQSDPRQITEGLRAEPRKGGKRESLRKYRRELAAANGQGLADLEEGDMPIFPAVSSDLETLFGKEFTMPDNTDNRLGALILAELAKAAQPTRAQMMKAARDNMKKAKGMRKSAQGLIADAHKVLKGVYMAKNAMIKAGKKPEPDADDGYDAAMSKLQKAWGNMESMKTYMKAADNQIAKAMGRTGQTSEEPMTGDADYTPPAGLTGESQNSMSRLGPAVGESGSAPPANMLDAVFPGKAAQKSYSPAEVEMALRLAKAEAEADTLRKLPAVPYGGRRPALMDTSKLVAGKKGDPGLDQALFEGVDVTALHKGADETENKNATARILGNMVLKGAGKSVFDASFHGVAGGGNSVTQ